MKESNNKTSGRSQAAESKSSVKHTTRNSATGTGANTGSGCGCGCGSGEKSSGRTPRGNNPEGINQYTKKTTGK